MERATSKPRAREEREPTPGDEHEEVTPLELDAVLALGALTAVCALMIIYEAIRFRDARDRIRGGGLPESMPAR